MKNRIITISREVGSGGRTVGNSALTSARKYWKCFTDPL